MAENSRIHIFKPLTLEFTFLSTSVIRLVQVDFFILIHP